MPQSEIVRAATEDWRNSLDRVRDFVEERTQKDSKSYIPAQNLYESYQNWCEANGEKPVSQRKLTTQMELMGYAKDKKKSGVALLGLRFRKPNGDGVTE